MPGAHAHSRPSAEDQRLRAGRAVGAGSPAADGALCARLAGIFVFGRRWRSAPPNGQELFKECGVGPRFFFLTRT